MPDLGIHRPACSAPPAPKTAGRRAKTLAKALGVTASAAALVAMGAGTSSAANGYFLGNAYSGLCAGVGSQTGNGAPVIQWGCNPSSSDERWHFVATTDSNGNRAYFMQNQYSGKCMGVGSSLANGAGVIQYTCNGAVDEKWWYSNGVFRNVYSGKCLGVGSSTTPGKQLIQWTCNGATDQLWAYSP
ncbi:RICIN domain-containing protein [Streptomyces sp. JNUCC 64]